MTTSAVASLLARLLKRRDKTSETRAFADCYVRTHGRPRQ